MMKSTLFNWLCATLLLGGIVLAGSDGPLFPWINLFGTALVGGFALIAKRAEQ